VLVCLALASGVFLAACGGGDDGSGGGGTPATGGGGQTQGAKVIDVNAKNGAKGEVTYCTGKDTTGVTHSWIKNFNEKYASKGMKVNLVEFPASADEQRNQFIQRQQAKSGDCDMFSSDVVWTAEFASQGWLYDLTPYMNTIKDDYIPAPLETVTFDNKIWGAPETSDAAFLFYAKDQVKSAPDTWQATYDEAKKTDGIVFQGAAYEGLTCDFLEIAFAAGGTVLNDDGTKATIDSPENLKALQLMTDAVQNGAAPKAVTTYMEPQADTAFGRGQATFMRNWTGSYALAQRTQMKGKFGISALPAFAGAGRAGVLGGHNSVISVYSKNPGVALNVIDFLHSPENQRSNAADFSLAPVTEAAYDDPAVKKALPYSAELKQAISQAKSRPVSPVYPQISEAIYKNVNQALSGQVQPEAALQQAQKDIEKALATF